MPLYEGYNAPTVDIHVALSFGSGFKFARFEDSKITFHKRPLPVNIHPTNQPFKGYLQDGAKIRIVIYICKFLDKNVSPSVIKDSPAPSATISMEYPEGADDLNMWCIILK